MKKIQILLTNFLFFSFLFSSDNFWSSHSANLLEKNRWEIGMFQPFRYGYSEKIEYSVHPILFFAMPNISVKKSENTMWGFSAASQFSLNYPTPLLNMVSRKGIGGLIDPNLEVPPMLGLSVSWLMSKTILDFNLTIKNGLDFGLTYGSLDKRASIDLPLVYHRLGIYNNGWGYHTGIDIQKAFMGKFEILFDIDLLLLPDLASTQVNPDFKGLRGPYSIEHKLLLSWVKSDRFKVTTGYKFVNAEFPFGTQSRILPYIPLSEKWVPIIELQWAGVKK